MEKEIWKDIPNYDGAYQVSSLGRVRSYYKVTGKGYALSDTFTIKKLSYCSRGYAQVGLPKSGSKKKYRVHQLVAMAFLGHTIGDRAKVVDHINNVKSDNRLKNLQVISQRLNVSKDKKGTTSKYTGVCWHKTQKKWISAIRINGKLKHLGTYSLEVDAHNAYQEELKKINAYI